MVIPGVLATPAGCTLHRLGEGKEQPASVESQHGLNVTVSFVSVSLYSSDGACSTTPNYIWAPLGDDSNVTGHKGHNIQPLNPWLPCRESRLGRVRSLSPTYSSPTSSQCINPPSEALLASK